MLITAFGISSEIKQPPIPHECCDICSRTGSCSKCTSVLVSVKSCNLNCDDDDVPIFTKPSPMHVLKSVRDGLREAIVAYR